MNILKKIVYAAFAAFLLAAAAVVAVSMGAGHPATEEGVAAAGTRNVKSSQTECFKTFDEYSDSVSGATPLSEKTKTLTPTDMLARRMADGLFKYFSRKDGWANCGTIHRKRDEILSLANTYAYIIVLAAKEQSEEDFALNPWGLMGVMLQESGLDPCATGKKTTRNCLQAWIFKAA